VREGVRGVLICGSGGVSERERKCGRSMEMVCGYKGMQVEEELVNGW
jgi:hypothetical protein